MEKFYEKRDSDLEEERQFDVSETARASGLMISVFVTSSVKKEMVEPDPEARKRGEDETTRLKDILSPLVSSIRTARKSRKSNVINFAASVTRDGRNREFHVISYLGPVREGSEDPCITLLLPEDLPEETA